MKITNLFLLVLISGIISFQFSATSFANVAPAIQPQSEAVPTVAVPENDQPAARQAEKQPKAAVLGDPTSAFLSSSALSPAKPAAGPSGAQAQPGKQLTLADVNAGLNSLKLNDRYVASASVNTDGTFFAVVRTYPEKETSSGFKEMSFKLDAFGKLDEASLRIVYFAPEHTFTLDGPLAKLLFDVNAPEAGDNRSIAQNGGNAEDDMSRLRQLELTAVVSVDSNGEFIDYSTANGTRRASYDHQGNIRSTRVFTAAAIRSGNTSYRAP